MPKLLEKVREVIEAEPVEDPLVSQVGLGNEFLGRVEVSLFLSVNRDFCLGQFCGFLPRHVPPPGSSHWLKQANFHANILVGEVGN